jgi:hypothetical protein
MDKNIKEIRIEGLDALETFIKSDPSYKLNMKNNPSSGDHWENLKRFIGKTPRQLIGYTTPTMEVPIVYYKK